MSNSRQIASLPNILTLIDDAGGQFIKQQAAGVTTSYTITWPSAVGSSGAVLALTDGSGGLGWQSTLGIALSGGTVNNSVIGGSTPAAITGTTITANTAFVGPLTGNSTTATALAAGRTFAFTGDATGTSASFDGSANVSTSLTLAASGVSAASYGSATAIPVLTVDAKGRITSATTAAISSALTIGADSGSNDTVTIGTDTLNFVGTGSEIETTVSNNQIQIGLPSTVSGLTTVSATNLQGALAGTIASTTTGTTAAASDNSTKIATTAYVTTALANLVDSAPAALDTLNELAAALGDDASFSTTVTNSIATKLALAGGTMTGNLILGDNVKALFGTGSDLEIYHDGSNSYIVDSGTGGILYRGGTQTFQNAAGSKTMAVLNGATSVDLYYDNSKKFETTAAGVTITGTGTATTFSATTLTGTLSTAAQPNVTSVGTLTSLNISGNLDATVTTPAQPNITSVGTLTSLNVSGTATANAFSGALTGNVTGNVSGSAATVTGAAQTAITSVGTLSALTVSGDVTIDTSTLKVDSSNNRVGILNASPDVTLDIGSATDSIHIPVGTTAQRPGSPAAGYFRYNSSLSQFEGYTSAWGAIGGGGTNTFNHNVFTGNGSTTAFTLAAATESENNLLVFIDGVFQEQGAYSIATSGGTTTLTMSAAPASGRKLVVYQVSAGVSGNNLNIDTMTGDGSDTTLTLSINPVNENNVQVFFDGVYQNKSTFSVSGTTLTFSTAPPTGVEVEAMTFTQTEVNVPVSDTIDTVHLKAGAVTTAKIESSLDLSGKSLTLPAVAVPSASTATTQAASDNTTKIATTAYVTTAIAALIDGAPGTLNTLNELAAALADDASFSSSVTTSLAAKANLAAPNFTGNVTFDSTTLTVDATNNRVGIGTASPATQMELSFAETVLQAKSTNASNFSSIRSMNSDSNQAAIIQYGASKATYGAFAGGESAFYSTTATTLMSDNASSGIIKFATGGNTERMRITTSGNVGINETAPFAKLHISDTQTGRTVADSAGSLLVLEDDENGMSILSANAGAGYILFGDVADSAAGGIAYDHSANRFRFRTNAAWDRMVIDASGNLTVSGTLNGISTTQSVSGNRWGVLPEIASNGVMEIGRYLDFHTTDGDTSDYGARFDYDGSKMVLTSAMQIEGNLLASDIIARNSGGLAFQTDEGTKRVVINDNGSVVIGPSAATQQGGGLLTLEGPDATMLVLHRTADTGDQEIKFMDHGDHNASIMGKNGGHLTFLTGANNFALRLQNTGEARFGSETVTRQSIAPVNSRKNGAAIEFGHQNNSAGYFGTIGAFGNNGMPYLGFSCASESSQNTFSTFGHAGNIIRGNLSGDLQFMKVASANATGQTPTQVAEIRADGDFSVAYTGTADTSGYFYAGKDFSATNHRINRARSQGQVVLCISGYGGSGIGADTALFFAVAEGFGNSAGCAMNIGRSSTNDRSINAGGSVNASGADYAEYMEKKSIDFDIAKGDICGVDATGKLTNKFSEAHSFVVKSTKPAYVGGDIWGSEDVLGLKPLLTKQNFADPDNEVSETDDEYAVRVAKYETDLATYEAALEAERIKYDRVAFSGQVPVNVTGATVGDYIIPKEATSDSITGEAVSSPSFEQYQLAVGKVWKILDDGRAFISVKIG